VAYTIEPTRNVGLYSSGHDIEVQGEVEADGISPITLVDPTAHLMRLAKRIKPGRPTLKAAKMSSSDIITRATAFVKRYAPMSLQKMACKKYSCGEICATDMTELHRALRQILETRPELEQEFVEIINAA
jgi:hypothetical protein